MRIAIIGYGRMGKAIEKIAEDRGHQVVLKVASSNKHSFNAGTLRQSRADVAIEFSFPEAALINLKTCFEAGVPVICGTTAWLDDWDEAISAMKNHDGTLLYASNFSLGVNVFFAINKKLAALMANLEDYTPRIHEVHHTAKLDAPSGTAITLAEQIVETIPNLKSWNVKEGTPDSLIVSSERTDPAPGTHHVTYTSEIDKIEIVHEAKSRKGFALGAVLAAEYLKDKKGLHKMTDVLGIQ